jgi:hypothetical protein
MFTPTQRISIGWDGTNNQGVIDASQVGFGVMPLKLNASKVMTNVLQLSGAAAQPACNSANNGAMWATGVHVSGVKDVVQVCAADASNAYAWRTIY